MEWTKMSVFRENFEGFAGSFTYSEKEAKRLPPALTQQCIDYSYYLQIYKSHLSIYKSNENADFASESGFLVQINIRFRFEGGFYLCLIKLG